MQISPHCEIKFELSPFVHEYIVQPVRKNIRNRLYSVYAENRNKGIEDLI